MARTYLASASLLLAAACGSAGTPGNVPALAAAVGQPFTLRPGQVAAVAGAGLQVGFDGVASDSRCPKGEQCVWAGDAVLRVWVQAAGGPRVAGELHTAPGRLRAMAAGAAHSLQLLQLLPDPVSGRSIAAGDHAAVLQVDTGGAARE